MAQAFAYYNFDADRRCQLVYTPGQAQAQVPHQYRQLPVRLRHHRRQLEQLLALGTQLTAGLEQLAAGQRQWRQVARPGTRATARRSRSCQVQKVFQAICLRPPSNAADRSAAAQITQDFQSGGYNMKQVVRRDRRLLHGQLGADQLPNSGDYREPNAVPSAKPVARRSRRWRSPPVPVVRPHTRTTEHQRLRQAAVYTGPAPAIGRCAGLQGQPLAEHQHAPTRCGDCHKAGGQSPMFARSDDVNQAYSAALTVVNLSQPRSVARWSSRSAAATTAGCPALRPAPTS